MSSITGRVTAKGRLGGGRAVAKDIGGIIGKAQKVYENDYNKLINKPQIEGNTLEGDKTFDELGMTPLSSQELADMWNN
jgi:hypothetical protein